MKRYRLLFIVLFSFLFTFSCSTKRKDFSSTRGGDIWFRSQGIELRFDSEMNIEILRGGEEIPLNFVGTGDYSKPSHFVVVNGSEVTGYTVDYDQVQVEPVETNF